MSAQIIIGDCRDVLKTLPDASVHCCVTSPPYFGLRDYGVDGQLAGCPAGGTVLDPFGGAGTTGLVADRLQRSAILIELNAEYAAIAQRRIAGDAPLLQGAAR